MRRLSEGLAISVMPSTARPHPPCFAWSPLPGTGRDKRSSGPAADSIPPRHGEGGPPEGWWVGSRSAPFPSSASVHRREGEHRARLDPLRPARGDRLEARVKVDALGPVN